MAKAANRIMYVCRNCGSESPKWQGRCPDCGEWNTYSEITVGGGSAAAVSRAAALLRSDADKPVALPQVSADEFPRLVVPGSEFNRVLGGGVVPGSLTLMSGDPGIGKSTMLLDVSAQLATGGRKVLYVSAEESIQQIKLRAERLGLNQPDLYLLGESDLDTVRNHITQMKPGLVVIDSIQTVFLPELPSTAGSVTQVRESTAALVKQAKTSH